jgi:hypothetical protein
MKGFASKFYSVQYTDGSLYLNGWAAMRAMPIWLLLIGGALLLLVGCATKPLPVASRDLPATAVKVTGSVRWRVDSSTPYQDLQPGTRLPAGSIVETGPENSGVDIALGNTHKPPHSLKPTSRAHDNWIRLYQGSRLTLNRLALTPAPTTTSVALNVRLQLSAGRALCAVVRPTEGSNSYEIDFAKGVARVRGAVFEVGTEGVVKVLVGRVSVRWPGSGEEQVVVGLQAFDTRTGVLAVYQ